MLGYFAQRAALTSDGQTDKPTDKTITLPRARMRARGKNNNKQSTVTLAAHAHRGLTRAEQQCTLKGTRVDGKAGHGPGRGHGHGHEHRRCLRVK